MKEEKIDLFILLIVHGSNKDFVLKYFEICYVYERKCGDIMFCGLNICMKYLTLVSSIMSTRIIVNNIRPLSTGIIVDIYIPWWRM